MKGDRPRTKPANEPQPPPEEKNGRPGRIGLDRITIGVAFLLMLIVGIFAYLENSPLNVPEMVFLFVVFFAVVLVLRWVWSRMRSARWRKT
jgi:hypothetical protein